MLQDNLYMLKPISLQINSHETNHKRKEISPVNQTHLWHLRLGHINHDRIHRLVTSKHLSPLDVNALPVCEPCLECKMTMRPFKAKVYRVKEVLELVQTDLCGPISTSARGGYEYFITFIDDYSRYGYIYLCTTSLKPLRNSKSIRQKWRTIEVRVSSLYDLIMGANTS